METWNVMKDMLTNGIRNINLKNINTTSVQTSMNKIQTNMQANLMAVQNSIDSNLKGFNLKGTNNSERLLEIVKPLEDNIFMAYPKMDSCKIDEDCMNLDLYSSDVDNIVYSCPDSKCIGNKCSCSGSCKKDPTTGFCCQDVIDIRGDKFCIENTSVPYYQSFLAKSKK